MWPWLDLLNQIEVEERLISQINVVQGDWLKEGFTGKEVRSRVGTICCTCGQARELVVRQIE